MSLSTTSKSQQLAYEILEKIDDIKQNMTDGDYKIIVDKLAIIHNTTPTCKSLKDKVAALEEEKDKVISDWCNLHRLFTLLKEDLQLKEYQTDLQAEVIRNSRKEIKSEITIKNKKK